MTTAYALLVVFAIGFAFFGGWLLGRSYEQNITGLLRERALDIIDEWEANQKRTGR